MEDTDLMPFGKHKGKEMADVPANYLIWLADNGYPKVRKDYPQVFIYINENKRVLIQESTIESYGR